MSDVAFNITFAAGACVAAGVVAVVGSRRGRLWPVALQLGATLPLWLGILVTRADPICLDPCTSSDLSDLLSTIGFGAWVALEIVVVVAAVRVADPPRPPCSGRSLLTVLGSLGLALVAVAIVVPVAHREHTRITVDRAARAARQQHADDAAATARLALVVDAPVYSCRRSTVQMLLTVAVQDGRGRRLDAVSDATVTILGARTVTRRARIDRSQGTALSVTFPRPARSRSVKVSVVVRLAPSGRQLTDTITATVPGHPDEYHGCPARH